MLEISCRNLVDPAIDTRKRFSWGVPATNERVLSHFTVSAIRNIALKGRFDIVCRTIAHKFGPLYPKRQRALGRSSLLSPAQDCRSSQLGTSVCYSAMPATRCPVNLRIASYCICVVFMLMRFSGAFGSGAAFALEDGWILARAVEYTRARERPLAEALEIFDEIRSPYYLRM